MFLSALLSQHTLSKVPTETVLIAVICFASVSISIVSGANVDTSYCRKYQSDFDRRVKLDGRYLPLLFMGYTWDKAYYITTEDYTADFFRAALYSCDRFNLKIASIKTACEYGIVDQWFRNDYPTNYSAWTAGLRVGYYIRPMWMTTGEPIDMSQYNIDIDYVGGQYPPGGYSPLAYPWNNCLSVSRNCPLFGAGHQNPCEQTPTYPDIRFSWDDCRGGGYRVICEQPMDYKKENEIKEDNDEVPDFMSFFPTQEDKNTLF